MVRVWIRDKKKNHMKDYFWRVDRLKDHLPVEDEKDLKRPFWGF